MEDSADIVAEDKGASADTDLDLADGDEVDFDLDAPGECIRTAPPRHEAEQSRNRRS